MIHNDETRGVFSRAPKWAWPAHSFDAPCADFAEHANEWEGWDEVAIELTSRGEVPADKFNFTAEFRILSGLEFIELNGAQNIVATTHGCRADADAATAGWISTGTAAQRRYGVRFAVHSPVDSGSEPGSVSAP
jgi:hypothetical protein